ncbi:ABC transporter permease [Cohaesibacter gelatinilyticus]|uniref:Putative spermidine/putrescine transport system permease protein n=1 Tax=Cohaesibacter gelatinilyticus TaxID=372072 RepID=A0A285NG35_9HYPH|nr:ABC transporter permease [Cohaesibacter gelatinilyticus]SNZ08415.1 putative spermidine/putrescine transport system permease protein [Cohaesibacter gelatinilyticus]
MIKLDPSLSKSERISVIATWIAALLVILFLMAPIITIVPLSFTSDSLLSYPIPDWSLRWYEVLFGSEMWMRALWNSLYIAFFATILAMILGTVASVGLTSPNFPFKGAVMGLLLTPMIVPIIITAVASYFFYAKLGLTNTYLGMILAHALLGTPFVVITVTATLLGFDTNQVRAAYSLGCKPIPTFFKIVVPQIQPGIISGGLFAFVTSFDEVIVALFMAGTEQFTLPRQMFAGIRENIDPTIAAVATVMILISLVLLLGVQWVTARSEKLRNKK